jgi:hypothetical protein
VAHTTSAGMSGGIIMFFHATPRFILSA